MSEVNRKWTEEMTYKFVELYVEEEVLWNPRKNLYKDKFARDDALSRIAVAMNIPGFNVEEVKNKIRSLRATFTGEKNKIEKSMMSGANEASVYKPNMKWFYLFEKAMEPSVRRKALNSELFCPQIFPIPEEPPEEKHTPDGSDFADMLPTIKAEPMEPSADDASTPPESYSFMAKPLFTGNRTLPKRKRNRVLSLESTVRELKSLTEKIHKKNNHPDEEECDIFGEYVSVQLKKLNPVSRIMAQQSISQLLAKARLEQIGSTTPCSSSSSVMSDIGGHFLADLG